MDSARPSELLGDAELEESEVVANSAMNRQRGLDGVNSYVRELGFEPLDLLLRGVDAGPSDRAPAWLDLCCGAGLALVQAARRRHEGQVTLVGVDLVDFFDPSAAGLPGLELVCARLPAWSPGRAFDLITCVHGLHYIGDKLGLLTAAAGWLTSGGLLVADLDLTSIRGVDGLPAGRRLTSALRASGFTYDARRRRIRLIGRHDVVLPYAYLGADDRAGPNYTGQPAVHSYYEPSGSSALRRRPTRLP